MEVGFLLFRRDRQDERGAEPVMRMGLLRLPEDKILQNVNVIDTFLRIDNIQQLNYYLGNNVIQREDSI
jgi:hypothetical protein